MQRKFAKRPIGSEMWSKYYYAFSDVHFNPELTFMLSSNL